jgi:signal transduction histidine kinase
MTAHPQHNIILKNKIGLKIFFLFVLCALIPLSVISSVSYLFVSHQLKSDAHYRLKQQCKAIGFGVFERLQFLENELTSIAREISLGQWDYTQHQPYDPVNREGSRFLSIVLTHQAGAVTPVLGQAAANLPEINPNALDHLRSGKSIIVMQEVRVSGPDLFLIRWLGPDNPSKGYLIAKIEPLYLWGIGAEGALPQNLEMVVCQPGRQILVSSFRNYEFSRPLIEQYRQNTFSGVFESSHKGETYISAYWSLFLKHQYRASDWVVVLSQSKPSILAPVSNFGTTFFLLLLLTFWVITLLSVHSIRKRMLPVEALLEGAAKFAAGDLDHRVDVKSGDELEVLADAFNDMGQKLKKSQAMVVQATKMSTFGQMAAGIVHEIGQPLTSISGYSDLLSHILTGEKPTRFITIIRREIKRLSDIIAKFRTFSRTTEEVFAPVQVNEVINHVHKLIEHQLKMKQVEIQLDLEEALPDISADRNGLQQVLLNLTMNAIDAMEEKGGEERHLMMRTFMENDNLTIEIEDNGCGIPDHAQDTIFEPFFTTKSEEKGTGLGLAILQSIVHKHNGEIRLTTEENVGTCFTLTFPLTPRTAHADPQ